MADSSDKLTPMFAQYQSIKKNYPDALLFFRMGDFYEMFFDDAATASRELQITLTTRNKNTPNAAPMCGVPWHAAQSYIAQLVERGYSVAVCDQVEDPKAARGIVRRAVTSVITPGTILDENSIDAKRHNFLGAVFCGLNDACGFAWADVSTGLWTGMEFRRQADLWQWTRKIGPAELLIMDGQKLPQGFNADGIRLVHQPAASFEIKRASERLLAAQGVQELGALGLADKPALTRACGAILSYLNQTQMRDTAQLMPFKPLEPGRRLLVDEFTERNLEIFQRFNGRKGKGTLRHLLDETITPMGGRLLEDMLRHPFREIKTIRQIQEAVAWFFAHPEKHALFRRELEAVLDIERILMRICLNRANPRDLGSLRQSLTAIPKVANTLANVGLTELPPAISGILANMDPVSDLAALLESALADTLPALAADGNIFRQGYNAELDAQLDLIEHGSQKLDEMLAKDREKSGISKLRLGCNRVFGYYYEAPRSSFKESLPDYFIPRQTLANSQRFATEELKTLEEKMLGAEEKRKELEHEMFQNLIAHVASQKERILAITDAIGHLDYWQSLAEVARRENWSMPELNDKSVIHIRQGRHPVVESILGAANFVPNDFHMDEEKRLCLLTGPNMAGKSTILRQVALICLLAQMGSMVPAEYAEIGIVDRLFSRVGASDDLAQGQSTFMVEMMETARILRQSTRRSLIILDEIGRGTGTFDGMAIAWSVVEELAGRCQKQLRTIFATHYHELTALEGVIPGLFTMNIAVGAYDSREIIFLHRLVPGPSDKSYGVEVARMAGIPYPVVQRAKDILKDLEQSRAKAPQRLALPGLDTGARQSEAQQNAFWQDKISALDLEKLAPEEALALLRQWQKEIGKSQ